jgi:hypothetical protein
MLEMAEFQVDMREKILRDYRMRVETVALQSPISLERTFLDR